MAESLQGRYGLALITCRDPYSMLMQWYSGTEYSAMALFYPCGNSTHTIIYNVYDDQTPFWNRDSREMDLQQVLSAPEVKSVIIYSFNERVTDEETKRFRQIILQRVLQRENVRENDLQYHRELLQGLAAGTLFSGTSSGYSVVNNILRSTFVSFCTEKESISNLLRQKLHEEHLTLSPNEQRQEQTYNPKSERLVSLLSQAFKELLVTDELFAQRMLRCRRSILNITQDMKLLGEELSLLSGVRDVDRSQTVVVYNRLAQSLKLPKLPLPSTVDKRENSLLTLSFSFLPMKGEERNLTALDDGALCALIRYLASLQSIGYQREYAELLNELLSEQARRT